MIATISGNKFSVHSGYLGRLFKDQGKMQDDSKAVTAKVLVWVL